MTKSVTFIFFIVSTIFLEKGYGLKCFQCISSLAGKCTEPSEFGLEAVYCTASLQSSAVTQINEAIFGEGWSFPVAGHSKCLKMIIFKYPPKKKEKPKPGRTKALDKFEVIIIRACQAADKNPTQFCEKIHNKAADFIQIKHCSICEDDECNASNRISSLRILLSNLLVIFPIYLFIS